MTLPAVQIEQRLKRWWVTTTVAGITTSRDFAFEALARAFFIAEQQRTGALCPDNADMECKSPNRWRSWGNTVDHLKPPTAQSERNDAGAGSIEDGFIRSAVFESTSEVMLPCWAHYAEEFSDRDSIV